jgi:gluconokinase
MQHISKISNAHSNTNLIIVMGVSGSGKSTIAKAIADHYHYCFLDADDFHSDENKNHMAKGLPLTDEMRTPWVNNIKNYLESAAKEQKHCVLAFSGLKRKHRDELRKAGLKTIFIFLSGDKELIQQRVNLRQNHFMNPGLVDSQFAALEDPTNETDVHAIAVNTTLDKITTHVIGEIEEYLWKN